MLECVEGPRRWTSISGCIGNNLDHCCFYLSTMCPTIPRQTTSNSPAMWCFRSTKYASSSLYLPIDQTSWEGLITRHSSFIVCGSSIMVPLLHVPGSPTGLLRWLAKFLFCLRKVKNSFCCCGAIYHSKDKMRCFAFITLTTWARFCHILMSDPYFAPTVIFSEEFMRDS